MAGAVINAVNVRLNAQTIAFLLGHCSASVVMVDQEYFPLAEEALNHGPSWCDSFFCCTVILNTIDSRPKETILPLPRLVHVSTAGASPPPSVLAAMSQRGFRVLHTYGLSETYGPSTMRSRSVREVARPDEQWGESPCAFVTLKPDVKKTDQQKLAEDIINFSRSKMPKYWVPKSVVFGPLPKTATGKNTKPLEDKGKGDGTSEEK
ncbi:Acetate/butyrate--CoA ligase aae7, peroxisomal [Datura stramonium]|uniref:Acetate/butyrate--CoA ligase aae7, peroxisomal n=1 Tax=Datura stramonium TaxID=4076 RepID=A0ABS8SZW8_DATST|nr:Acetate/butyrate--CoA ligase aae7, peroxisomal [Datura stramonium]